MKQLIIAACVALSLTTFTGLALADKGHKPIAKTAVSIEQAIKAVTDKYPGRVIEAELEDEDGKVEYEITVVSNNGESREFIVDAQSGQVSEDHADDKHESGGKK